MGKGHSDWHFHSSSCLKYLESRRDCYLREVHKLYFMGFLTFILTFCLFIFYWLHSVHHNTPSANICRMNDFGNDR